MSGYLLNFVVYTAAMVGVIFVAVLAYKNFSYTKNSASKYLNIEESISLAPRKNLYIVKAGNERFLIASDAERTSLISKLEEENNHNNNEQEIENVITDSKIDELPVICCNTQRKKTGKTTEETLKGIVKSIK